MNNKPETNTIADRLESIARRCSYEDDRMALTAAAEAIRQYFIPAQSKSDDVSPGTLRHALRSAAAVRGPVEQTLSKIGASVPPQESISHDAVMAAAKMLSEHTGADFDDDRCKCSRCDEEREATINLAKDVLSLALPSPHSQEENAP